MAKSELGEQASVPGTGLQFGQIQDLDLSGKKKRKHGTCPTGLGKRLRRAEKSYMTTIDDVDPNKESNARRLGHLFAESESPF